MAKLSKYAAACLMAAAVFVPTMASAGQYGYMTYQSPGNACRTVDPYNPEALGIYAYFSAVDNGAPDQNTAWCPLHSYSAQGFFHDPGSGGLVSVEVSPGWINTGGGNSSCYVALFNGTGGYTFGANGIAHNSWGTDTISWTNLPTNVNNIGAEVQCNLPQWAIVYNYRERMLEYFDWTSW